MIDPAEFPHVAKMPLYKGLPRLFTAIEVGGRVDFAVTDAARWLQCLQEKRCGVCGTYIHSTSFYALGGPESAKQGAFFDPPMHRDCAEWSMQNCPYLVGKRTYLDDDAIARRTERLDAAGGLQVHTSDVAEAPEISLFKGRTYSFPHRTPSGQCWVIESGFEIVTTQERKCPVDHSGVR